MLQMCENESEAGRRANVNRPLTHSSDVSREGLAMQATRCSVTDCTKPAKCRGWCVGHYTRWVRTGDTGPSELWDRKRKPCAVADCDRLARAYGYCEGHRSRNDRGDLRPDVPLGQKPPVTYSGAHSRVAKARGKAADHACVDCGNPAQEWAYDGLDEHEVTDGPRRFSRNPAHYMPMCVPCHRAFDMRHRHMVGAA